MFCWSRRSGSWAVLGKDCEPTMDFLFVTGMSGAGKTVAVNELEDMGYFCVDSKDSKPGHLVFNRSVSLKDSFKK